MAPNPSSTLCHVPPSKALVRAPDGLRACGRSDHKRLGAFGGNVLACGLQVCGLRLGFRFEVIGFRVSGCRLGFYELKLDLRFPHAPGLPYHGVKKEFVCVCVCLGYGA